MNTAKSIIGKLANLFKERYPDTKKILGVYAIIVSLIYSWTLITSFYKIPSWLFFLTISQILSIYAYSFLVNLVESIIILAGVLLLEFTIFIPLKNKDEFQSRSTLIVSTFLLSTMLRLVLYKSFEASESFVNGEPVWWILTLLLGILFAVFIPKSKTFRNMIEGMAERVVILLYIYMPLSLLSIIVILVRNIN